MSNCEKKVVSGSLHECDPELIGAGELGQMLRLSKTTIHKMRSLGKLPLPVRIGRTIRWRVTEIRKWIAEGCPILDEWEKRQKEGI